MGYSPSKGKWKGRLAPSCCSLFNDFRLIREGRDGPPVFCLGGTPKPLSYIFIDNKNSMLLFVFFIFSMRNSMLSTTLRS